MEERKLTSFVMPGILRDKTVRLFAPGSHVTTSNMNGWYGNDQLRKR